MTYVFTFPGQGSQTVGMGQGLAQAFPAARAVFDEVDEALGEHLSQIAWSGPEQSLTLTKNAQPALMAVSLAVIAVLRQEYGDAAIAPAFVAGHSLGEYSALAAAGVFSLPDTARLLRLRGLAMQEAMPEGDGTMLALLGAELEPAQRLAAAAAEDGVCQVANDNAPGQIVISGSKAAIDRALRLASDFGIRRAVPLAVSAPFHSALMQPAADRMALALRDVAMKEPVCPLISNVTASPVSDPETIRTLLIKQVTGVVRWRESVAYMADHGANTIFEIGAGKVLTGLARRIRSEADCRAIGAVEDIKFFGAWLSGRVTA
jgi:[acyl-carrier-protein] S-malonyltransferase